MGRGRRVGEKWADIKKCSIDAENIRRKCGENAGKLFQVIKANSFREFLQEFWGHALNLKA
jgi:hypothetical protein